MKTLKLTPLHQATHLFAGSIKVLVKMERYRLKDNHGKTCLNYAREMDSELIDLLQKLIKYHVMLKYTRLLA